MSNLEQYWEKDLEEADLKLDDLIKKSNAILASIDYDSDKEIEDRLADNNISDDEYFKSEEKEYDPDSSPIAWKYYKETNEWINEDVNMKKYTSSGITRICGSIKKDDNSINVKHVGYEKYKCIDFAGDCVFNFRKDGKTDNSIIKKIIKKYPNDVDKGKLKICRAMHHSPYNFSLMPRTGGMNNRKKADRPDWLLAGLENLYNKYGVFKSTIEKLITDKEELLKLQGDYRVITSGNCNDIILADFLRQIGSVEEYAKIFLDLDDDDKPMIDTMIDFGKKEIKSADDLNQYMDLAIQYWEIQQKKYRDKKIKNVNI